MLGFLVACSTGRPLGVWSLDTVEKMELFEAGSEVSHAPSEGFSMGVAAMADMVAQMEL